MQTLPKERHYETLSYLPPLSDAQITRQIEYTLKQGFYPAIEFNEDSDPAISTGLFGSCPCSTPELLKKF